ncbi:MAG: WG repeat-containing protein [Actinomycetota bacterium]
MPSQEIFSDIQNHWAKVCILALAQRQLLNGYPDGTFRPNAPVSRVEFAALLSRVFPETALVRNAIAFTDVPATYWGNPAIQFATRAGFLSGYPDRTFKPNEAIPRVQAIAALASGLQYSIPAAPLPVLQQYFDDAATIPNYAVAAIAAATVAQMVVNYPQVRQLKPNQNTTRGELAALICQTLIKPWQISPVLPYVVGNPISRGSRSAFGSVVAEVSNFRLRIARQGLNVHDGILPLQPSLTSYQGAAGVVVVDLDKDGEPEVIVDVCDHTNYFTSLIYYYQPDLKKYLAIAHPWGEVAYQLQDVNRDGTWELVSGQRSFDSFSQNPLDSALPIAIWKYQQGQLIDVTPTQPDQIRDRANLLLQEYRNRQRLQQEVKAILAAYLAEQYLLNKKREGWYVVRQGYQGSDAKDYFAAVIDALVVHNYLTVEFLIAPQFDALEAFSEGIAAVQVNGSWSYSDYSGRLLIPPQCVGVESFKQGQGLVRIGNKYGYLDKRGNFAIPPQFEGVGAGLSEGLLAVKLGNQWGYLNNEKQMAIPPQFDSADRFSEGLALVCKGSKYGYIDASGNLAVPLQLDGGDAFLEGLARVWVADKVGYLDKMGKWVIQPQFDYAESFQGGIARVSIANKWGYIDRQGKLLMSTPVPALLTPVAQPEYDHADPVTGRLMRVRKGEKWGYVDPTGKLTIAPQFDRAEVFQEDLAKVKIGNKYGYIDASGKVTIKPDFDEAYSFLNGIAIVKVNQKYGYIDRTGKLVIKPQFEAASAFQEELAVVRIAKKYGYIDRTGKVVIQPQFDGADNFTGGLARVKIGERWGYIHTTGKFVIAPKFDWVESFNQGLARVRASGKWGYLKHPFNF